MLDPTRDPLADDDQSVEGLYYYSVAPPDSSLDCPAPVESYGGAWAQGSMLAATTGSRWFYTYRCAPWKATSGRGLAPVEVARRPCRLHREHVHLALWECAGPCFTERERSGALLASEADALPSHGHPTRTLARCAAGAHREVVADLVALGLAAFVPGWGFVVASPLSDHGTEAQPDRLPAEVLAQVDYRPGRYSRNDARALVVIQAGCVDHSASAQHPWRYSCMTDEGTAALWFDEYYLERLVDMGLVDLRDPSGGSNRALRDGPQEVHVRTSQSLPWKREWRLA